MITKRSFCLTAAAALVVLFVSGCQHGLDSEPTACPVCQEIQQTDNEGDGDVADDCRPVNFRQPTCRNDGRRTMDAETGECNGPPNPVWDYWECIPTPPLPQSIVEHNGGQWCGEGGLPEHAYIWVTPSQDGRSFAVNCMSFGRAPTVREWQDQYRYFVAGRRWRMAQPSRMRADEDVGFGPAPSVPEVLTGGGTWCGETVPDRLRLAYGSPNCQLGSDGRRSCQAGCISFDRTPTADEWREGYERAVMEAVRFQVLRIRPENRSHPSSRQPPGSGGGFY
ncbi:MAG: hypothetical protein ABIJ46_00845 [bacterium]